MEVCLDMQKKSQFFFLDMKMESLRFAGRDALRAAGDAAAAAEALAVQALVEAAAAGVEGEPSAAVPGGAMMGIAEAMGMGDRCE